MDAYEHNQKVAAGFQKVINALFFVVFGILVGSSFPSSSVGVLQNVLYFVIFLCAIAVMYFGQFRGRHQKQK